LSDLNRGWPLIFGKESERCGQEKGNGGAERGGRGIAVKNTEGELTPFQAERNIDSQRKRRKKRGHTGAKAHFHCGKKSIKKQAKAGNVPKVKEGGSDCYLVT